MSNGFTYTQHKWRLWIIAAVLFAVTAGLIWRVIDLNILNRPFLQGQSNARIVRTINIPAYRGMITDRNGEPLAISTPVDSVWVNPQAFFADDEKLAQLSGLLGLPMAEIREHLAKNRDREFIYLKRGIAPNIADTIKALGISGLFTQREYRRFYPEGEVTSHILGFTNIDDQGQEGIELVYDYWLRGGLGRKRVIKDRLGHTVAEVATLREPQPGHDLALSIDRRIQYLAYRELKIGIEKYQARSGSAIVLDVKTGEVLAMANWPSFNPNNRPAVRDGRYRNRALTDLFEPASTIKAFGMASALASGKYTINSRVNTSPGWILVDGKRIADEHDNGVLDLTTILQRSSNVGMSRITLSLPPASLWEMLHRVGFGQLTSSGFPGERPGLLVNHNVWNPFVLSTLSFGYGLSVNALQLTQAYAILAAGGMKRPVTMLRNERPASEERIMPQAVAQTILTMLESVLQRGGTAPLARVPGYRVTGKTGTAHIVGLRGYEKNRYNSIFVGIAPASSPRLVVLVVLHDPQGKDYYGGYTAGPIFSRIMGGTLRLLDIPPDGLQDNLPVTGKEPVLPRPHDD